MNGYTQLEFDFKTDYERAIESWSAEIAREIDQEILAKIIKIVDTSSLESKI